jgi:long-chain acyl-CoA synthetase
LRATLPGTLIEIRDMDDPTRVLPVGEKGEICVRGPQVMAGYWNKPEETANVFVDGALRTGDIGYIDEDGYIFLIDRMKDMILCGGYNVYPRVIEEAAYQHPAIEEAIAIGMPDPYRGQAPKLFVKLREGHEATPPEIRAFLEGLAQPYRAAARGGSARKPAQDNGRQIIEEGTGGGRASEAGKPG